MLKINMFSSAEKIKGQGVASAYKEQVALVKDGLSEKYEIYVNKLKRCDINHYHTINLEYYILNKIDGRKNKSVGYVHFLPNTIDESLSLPKLFRSVLYKYIIDFYDSMDYLVTVNPSFIKLLQEYGIDSSKVTYIPNYVSDETFFPIEREQALYAREKYGLSRDGFVVLGVGQVQTRKGVLDFVETAKKLPEISFVWAGGFSFGPMTEGYKELKELMQNPPENVKFLGIVDREDMNSIFNMADILFLPSFSELFPMTVLEAMCCKKPILLRELDLYQNILFDYYIKGSSIDDFTQAITNLTNAEFYTYWQEKSWAGHIRYSRESVLKMWEDFYDKVNSSELETKKALSSIFSFHK